MSRAVPKYRRHPNGQAFVQIKGRRIYLGTFGSEISKKRYTQILTRLQAEQPQQVVKPAPGRTIVELIVIYLAFAERYYSKNGRPSKEYVSMASALQILERLHGESFGDEFGPAELIAVQDYMVAADYARTVINQQVGRIKRFFRWCCKKNHLPKDLYHGLLCVDWLKKGRCDARESERVEPVDRQSVEATLPHMTPTVAAMVQVQLLCGMRPAEVCMMRGCDINCSGDIWIYSPPEHKNAWRDLKRHIAIPKAAQVILKPFLTTNLEAYLFSPRDSEAWRLARRAVTTKPDRKTPIYPSELRAREKAKLARKNRVPKRPKRERYDTDSYRRAITYSIKKANKAIKQANKSGVEIPHWHPHQLRHTISTEISQTIGEQAAQRWLGHEHLETTGIYSQKQVKELVEIARMLDQRWAG